MTATIPLAKPQKGVAVFRFVPALVVSVFYAYVLSGLPHGLFRDRENYLNLYAQGYDAILGLIDSVLKWFFAEPLFLYVNKFLRIWLSPEETVSAIVFFNGFSVSFFCFRRTTSFFAGFLTLALLTFNISVLLQQIVVIRQGLALALFLLFYYSFKNETHRAVFIACLGLIHVSFFVVFLFVCSDIFLRKIKDRVRYIVLFIGGFVLFSLMDAVMRFTGAKVEYIDGHIEASGLMFIVLILLFLFFNSTPISERKSSAEIASYHLFASLGLIIMTAAYFTFPMMSGRMMGVVAPFIYAYLLRCHMSGKNLIVLLLFVGINIYLLFFKNGLEQGLLVSQASFFRALLY